MARGVIVRPMTDRAFDIVVFGATGFTGRLVADYLAAHAPAKTKWALAGRNEKTLEGIRNELVAAKPQCAPSGVVVASVSDAPSLTAMARSTQVVLTTVGPYAEHGEPVVRACVDAGTDYVDITGEPEFVEKIIDTYDSEARQKKIRIVSCCGFDSIPHDLGALFTAQHLPADAPMSISGYVKSNGTFSGGTWQSAVRAMGNMRAFQKEQAARKKKRGANGQTRKVAASKAGIRYVRELHSWACPLPTIDPQIVLRSARDLDVYGPDFRYGHFARIKHVTTLVGGAVGVGVLFSLAQLPPTRALLLKVKKSGDGPSPEQRAKAFFNVTFIGEGGGRRVVTEVTGGDPGYTETSKMIAEAALTFALDRDKIPARYGVLTPAVAMGDVLRERLQKAGIGFRVVREEAMASERSN